MPIIKSIARPYAKAAFEYAAEHNDIPAWSEFLQKAAHIVRDEKVKRILEHPEITIAQTTTFMLDTCCQNLMDQRKRNFIKLLASNRRLSVIPEIAALFENQRKEKDKSVSVNIITALSLSGPQKEKLLQALKIRLQRAIIPHFRMDPSLLGGVIIRAGDFVIDGSVRGKLERLRLALES